MNRGRGKQVTVTKRVRGRKIEMEGGREENRESERRERKILEEQSMDH